MSEDEPQRKPAGKGQPSTHARARAARAEAERKRRTRILLATGASVVVVAILVVLIVVKLSGGSNSSSVVAPPPGQLSPNPAPVSAVTGLASIPMSSIVTAMGAGASLSAAPQAVTMAPPPNQGTKPEMFFVGAEYCPYCAAERWVMVTALSKFGTFSGLGQTSSSATDVDPSTPTLSFYGSTYTSQYIDFESVEQTTNQPQGNSYVPLQTLTPTQAAYTQANNSSGGIPWIDIAGKYTSGVQYDPAILKGMTFDQVAAAAVDNTTTIGKTIQAAAGALISSLCKVTGAQPAAVCSVLPAGS
jgi:hypothetical protein